MTTRGNVGPSFIMEILTRLAKVSLKNTKVYEK